MSTTLRGARLDEPEMPTGQIVLQPPPQIEPNEGAGGVLMNAIPMLGSLGSIVLVATMGGAAGGGRSYLAAGMFLFATLGFVVVQLDRQRKQRTQQVTGSRTEYLRYLANVRKVAREAADQQRRALPGTTPTRRALPALAEERSRVWEHARRPTPASCTSATACARQPLCARAGAAGDARRSTRSTRPPPRRCTGCSSCTGCSPTCPPSSTCAPSTGSRSAVPRTPARALARAMICSAAAFHSPEHLVVAVLASEQNARPLGLGQVAAARARAPQQSDAVGPTPDGVHRRSTTWPRCCPPDLGDRPRFGADERPADPAHPARRRRRRRCRPATTSSRPTACTA